MAKQGTLLVVDDNRNILTSLQYLLEEYFQQVITLNSPVTIPSLLQREAIDVVLLDMNFSSGINSGNEGLYWLREIKRLRPQIQVVLFTAYADINLAVTGLKDGATDFIVKPWDNAKLVQTLQAKLLTVIQKRYFIKVGSNTPQPTNIRLICATNRNLDEMVHNGEFREDLLYRINTIHLHIPALRERKEDILPLAQRFLEQYNQQYLRTLTGFSADAEQRLLNYPWYGNIRELQHTIEKAVILSDGNLLKAENLQLTEVSGQDAPATHEESKEDTPLQTLDEMEKNLVKKAIEQCDGNLSQAAAQLGITRQTLYNKMKRHGI